jgi:hypothetical protein
MVLAGVRLAMRLSALGGWGTWVGRCANGLVGEWVGAWELAVPKRKRAFWGAKGVLAEDTDTDRRHRVLAMGHSTPARSCCSRRQQNMTAAARVSCLRTLQDAGAAGGAPLLEHEQRGLSSRAASLSSSCLPAWPGSNQLLRVQACQPLSGLVCLA